MVNTTLFDFLSPDAGGPQPTGVFPLFRVPVTFFALTLRRQKVEFSRSLSSFLLSTTASAFSSSFSGSVSLKLVSGSVSLGLVSGSAFLRIVRKVPLYASV